jgi:CHAP domain
MTINFDEFINKWLGKVIDYDGHYGGQCFDVVNQHLLDCIGYKPLIKLVRAADILRRPDLIIPAGVEYEVIMNEPNNFPQSGDWIVWNEAGWNANYGHVGICLTSNTKNGDIFQQDGLNPTQGTKIIKWSFKSPYTPAGWIRFKNKAVPEDPQNGDLIYPFRNVLGAYARDSRDPSLDLSIVRPSVVELVEQRNYAGAFQNMVDGFIDLYYERNKWYEKEIELLKKIADLESQLPPSNDQDIS